MGVSGCCEVRHPSQGFILHPRPYGEPDPHLGCVQVQHWWDAMWREGVLYSHPLEGFHPDIWTGCCAIGEPLRLGQDGQVGTGIEAEPLPRHPVGSVPAAEPSSQSRGCRAGARLPGTPQSGHPRGPGAPAAPARSHSSVKAVFLAALAAGPPAAPAPPAFCILPFWQRGFFHHSHSQM